MFEEFLGKQVKAPYKDAKQFKIARGKLEEASGGFIKVTGRLGTIIINKKRVEKMSEARGR